MDVQVLQSCRNPLGGASASVHRQSGRCTRWRASCASLCCAQRRTHSAFLWAGFGVLQYIDKVVDVGDAVALWRLVKEFHIFSTCSRCLLGIYRISYDVGALFIDRVTVYEMACFLCFPLLCRETGTHSAFLLAGFGEVVDVGDAVALWRLVKEFHFFTCCTCCSPGIWTLFPRAPCSGSHLPLCVATVHGSFWANFFI